MNFVSRPALKVTIALVDPLPDNALRVIFALRATGLLGCGIWFLFQAEAAVVPSFVDIVNDSDVPAFFERHGRADEGKKHCG